MPENILRRTILHVKALLLAKYGHLEIADLPAPVPGANDVLVRVATCGICGSDVHGFDGSTGRRIPPLVMGHEAAGTVAAVGSNVRRFSAGERVTFDSTISCGHCAYCSRSEHNLCDNRRVLGVACGDYSQPGAFAEYVSVPEHIVYRLPENLSFAEAAMLEPVSVAVHAVELSTVAAGETVLVIGAGMIGLLIVQALRAQGCRRILVADVKASRLQLARQAGAAEILQLSGADLVSEIRRFTSGGVDLVIEAVGMDVTVRAAIECARKGGRVTLVGNVAPEVTLPLQSVVSRQIRLQGSCASCGEYPQAIELIASGAIQVKSLISAIAPLEEGPAWFQRLHAGEPNLMKVVLTPGEAP